jgi:MFS family permease
VLGLFGGAVADRLERKRLIQASQAGVAAIALFLGLAVTTDTVTWGHLLASSLLQGALMSFLMPARQSIIPDIVGRANLSNAMALHAAGVSVTTLAAPGVAGLLYALIGPQWVYYITGAMGLAAVVLTTSITRTRAGQGRARLPMLADVKAGLAYVRGNGVVLAIMLLLLATFLFAHTVVALLPAVVTDVYHRKSEAYGLLVSVEGAGALAGSLFFASMGASRRGRLLIVSSIAAGFALLLMSLVPLYLAAVAFMTGLGVAEAGRRVLSQSLLMEEAEDQYRGRAISIYAMMAGLMPLGILPAGIALDLLGGQMTVGILAGATIAASALVFLTQPSLRAMP